MRSISTALRRLAFIASSGLVVVALTHCGSAPKVGSACAKDADCGSSGAVCLTSSGVYAGGYCSRFCDQDTDCGGAAYCERSTGNGLCVVACTQPADCRLQEGYDCTARGEDGGRKSCLPRFPVIDGGPGTPDGGPNDAGPSDGG